MVRDCDYDYRVQAAQKEVEQLIESGAPIVKLDIFDMIKKYTPSDSIKDEIEYTKELYLELVDKFKALSDEDQSVFLKTLKDSDIIDNQSIEKEDSFLIALNKNYEDVFAIDVLLDKVLSEEGISKEEFVRIHDILLQGTSSEDRLGLRNNDLRFVGSYQDNPQTKYHFGNRAISYFPLRHTEIDQAIETFLNFFNSGVKPNNEYDIALLPMITHGLLAALQLFKDGNTRYGRMFQSVLLFKLANEDCYLSLPLPIVYASRQYAAFRDDYRKKVEDIVVKNDAQAWEDWFFFNLRRIQDGIFYNMNCLSMIAQRHKGNQYSKF